MKPATVRILVGNCEPILTECMITAVRECVGNQCPVGIIETDTESSIRRVARESAPDLILLILNNINYGLPPNPHLETIIQKGRDLVAYVKSQCEAPVIVVSGLTDDPALPRQLRELGADAYFDLPFNYASFAFAAQRCLNQPKHGRRVPCDPRKGRGRNWWRSRGDIGNRLE